jgi:hypothetical protein
VVEDRNGADTKVRDLVDDYLRSMSTRFTSRSCSPVKEGLSESLWTNLTLSTSCWGQSAVEACSPVSASQHRHSDTARGHLCL